MIRTPVSDTHFVDFMAEGVGVDVPFLLRLLILNRLMVIGDFGDDALTFQSDRWTMDIVRKCGHAYLEWTPSIMYFEK